MLREIICGEQVYRKDPKDPAKKNYVEEDYEQEDEL
jgi:hypothetical protein